MTIHVYRPTDPSVGLSDEELDALYAELPTVDCQRRCYGACASIQIAASEFDRISRYLGYVPRSDDSGWCPILDRRTGLCRAHEVKGAICRLWGICESMQCPFGCKVTPRLLTEDECYEYLFRSGAYGSPLSREQAREYVAKARELGFLHREPPRPGYNMGLPYTTV